MTTIPFKREFDFEYGRCDTLSPLIRRVVASNPGPFTFTGTGVYIVGHGTVAMIDPGPLDAAHEAALDQALEGERVSHVLVTHHHLDHSPLAARMASRHRCKTYGRRARPTPPAGSETRMEAGDDDSFAPDVELKDGDVLTGPGWTLEALHTPGHTSNHLCFALKEENTLFSGDHVMAWSTSVVSPPDGHMGDYISQLERIRARGFGRIWPTHGPAIDEPEAFLDAYIEHRRARERQILSQIEAGRTTIREMVSSMYADVDKRLHPAAAHSVLAHIIHLVEQGRIEVADGGTPDLGSTYTLTG